MVINCFFNGRLLLKESYRMFKEARPRVSLVLSGDDARTAIQVYVSVL